MFVIVDVCKSRLLSSSSFQLAASRLIGVCIDWSSFLFVSTPLFWPFDAAPRNPLAFAETTLTATEALGKIVLNGQTDTVQ